MTKKAGCLGAFGIFFLIIIIAVVISSIGEEKKLTETEIGILKYTIVDKEDISYAGTPRMVYRVVIEVEKIPANEQLEKIALQIWKNGNKDWKEFTVFMYLPDMDTKLAAYGVAEFRPQGLKEFRIQEFALYGTKWES